jgi:ATP-dependent Lon protease
MPTLPENLTPAPEHPELPPESLRWYVDTTLFDFPSTAFVEPIKGIIGQRRALEALTIGAEIFSPGYNIFVSGLSGTGRLSTIKSILERINPDGSVPHDYAFVNNFDNPDAPRLLKFPRGKAVSFQAAMTNAIQYLRAQIPKMFEDESFRTGRKKIIEDFQGRERKMLADFEEHIKPAGFALGQAKTGTDVVQPEILPIINGKPYPVAALDQLVKEEALTLDQAKEIGEKYEQMRSELFDLAKQGMKLSQEFQKEISSYEYQSASIQVQASIDEIRDKFPFEDVKCYLDEVKEDILNNLDTFKKSGDEKGEEENNSSRDSQENDPFRVYCVNVVLDNSKTEGAPVIIETTPTFVNLFGTVERVPDPRGIWSTDFTRIKGGSLLRADGGYLIINAPDALSEPGVWKALKRVLLHRKLEIQSFESFFQTNSQASAMKPQAIDLNVKVIMIGDSRLYHVLYSMEEDFRKIFKINAQFDYEIARTDSTLHEYAGFIRRMSDEEHLLHFDRDGVAAVIEYAVEQSGNQGKISLRFSDVADLLREASFWAEKDAAEVVSRYHVEKARDMMIDRDAMWKEKNMERIIDGTLMIDTEGAKVGQINGLAVYSVGQSSFGKPTRITATVSVGAGGIVSIEREARLSGSVYNKGSMILAGFFRNRFAQKRPLSLAAAVVFEQSYGGIDGDSASSTEIYALLSALSRVPIKQSLAVTGSVNQWGEIQPIGGVKEKIEGFYDVCKSRVLTGQQGVLIPVQNVSDLMLRDDVVESVEAGQFHIYPVSSIDRGIEILTGVAAGTRDQNGQYPAGTINNLVEARFAELSESLRRSMPFLGDGMPSLIRTETISDEEIAGNGDQDN